MNVEFWGGDFIKKSIIVMALAIACFVGGCGKRGQEQGNTQVAAWEVAETAQAGRQRPEQEKAQAKIDKGGEDEVVFLGSGSSNINVCQVYHGEKAEEINLEEPRGKYLLQMLSEFLENPEYEYMGGAGMLDLSDKSLGDLAKSNKGNYFVYIQFDQGISYAYPEKVDAWSTQMQTENIHTLLIKVGKNTLTLNRQAGEGIFYPLVCQDPEMEAGFLERCSEWDRTEDWTEAYGRLKKENAQLDAKKAKGQRLAEGADVEGDTFLGVETDAIQSAKIFHGEDCQELPLEESKGREFLQRLSGFLAEKKYSEEGIGMLDGESLGNLEHIAQENGEDYYVLVQFGQPITITLAGAQGGAVCFRDSDMLLVEASKSGQSLRLLWHHPDTGENIPFYGTMGADEKGIYQDFLNMYQEWEN